MRRLLLVPIALGLAACAGSDGPDCGGTAPVAGTWEYHAVQDAPPPGATLVGTLEVFDVSGCEFTGALSVDVTPNGGGPGFALAGPFFGIAVSSSVVNFDAQLNPGVTRTHVADVISDSLAGEWIEGSGTTAPRGSFWARRTAP